METSRIEGQAAGCFFCFFLFLRGRVAGCLEMFSEILYGLEGLFRVNWLSNQT